MIHFHLKTKLSLQITDVTANAHKLYMLFWRWYRRRLLPSRRRLLSSVGPSRWPPQQPSAARPFTVRLAVAISHRSSPLTFLCASDGFPISAWIYDWFCHWMSFYSHYEIICGAHNGIWWLWVFTNHFPIEPKGRIQETSVKILHRRAARLCYLLHYYTKVCPKSSFCICNFIWENTIHVQYKVNLFRLPLPPLHPCGLLFLPLNPLFRTIHTPSLRPSQDDAMTFLAAA